MFDKVNENSERFAGARMPYADIVNVSMNQVLMRSLNTSIAAVLPCSRCSSSAPACSARSTLQEFALALLVGLITGSYSSIFVATPLLAMLKEREPRYRTLRGQHATGAELERLVLGGSPSRDAATRRRQRRAESAGGDVVAAGATADHAGGRCSPIRRGRGRRSVADQLTRAVP